MNILYIDDYLNYYSEDLKEIIKIKPYKKTICNGVVIDSKKFINLFSKVLKEKNINNNFLRGEIIVIINNNSVLYKENMQKILEELNYRKIKFVNEKSLINIDAKTIFINANSNYVNLYYLDNIGKVRTELYPWNKAIRDNFLSILFSLQKSKYVIVGKNTMEIKNLFNEVDNYYYYENYSDYFIEKLLFKNK